MVLTYLRQPHGRLIVNIFRSLLCSLMILWVSAGCGTTHASWSFQREVLAADAMADDGDYAGALSEFTRLSKYAEKQVDLQHLQFRSAYMLEQMGRAEEALAAYERIYTRPTHPYDENASRAMYRAGRVYRDLLGQPETALEIWVATVRAFPDGNFAGDALNQIVRVYEKDERYEELMELYADLYSEVRDREIAHILAYKTATTLDDHLDRCFEAIEMYRFLQDYFTRSGLIDDAVWRTALCYRRHDMLEEEYAVLADFVDGRETSVIFADYDHGQYNPAMRRMAVIHEEWGDLPAAIKAYRRFQRTYPLSMDNDDVQYRIIQLYDELGDTASMRRYAAELQKLWPESRYVSRAEALIREAESR